MSEDLDFSLFCSTLLLKMCRLWRNQVASLCSGFPHLALVLFCFVLGWVLLGMLALNISGRKLNRFCICKCSGFTVLVVRLIHSEGWFLPPSNSPYEMPLWLFHYLQEGLLSLSLFTCFMTSFYVLGIPSVWLLCSPSTVVGWFIYLALFFEQRN